MKQSLLKLSFQTILALLLVLFLSSLSFAQTKVRGVTSSKYIQPSDIVVLGTWKANAVRYPLEWLAGASTSTQEEYEVWLEEALTNFDALIPSFEAAGIKVVLNLYSPPGGFSNTPSCSNSHKMLCEQWAQDLFIASWEKIATRYAGNTTIYGFDLANEPGFRKAVPGLKSWNELADTTVQAIRAIDSTRHIIIEPPFGDIFRLSQLTPLPYDNLSYSPHFYYPLQFQYQGMGKNKIGMKYPSAKINKKLMEARLKHVIKFAKANPGARMYIGEFSAVRWAPGKSSYNYLKDALSIFEKYGWDWTYHAFREADAWSLEHDGNIKNKLPSKKTPDRLKLMREYLARNKPL